MAVAFYTGNVTSYLNMMSRSTPLMSCLANSHLDTLRRRLLESIYRAHNTDIPLAFISSILGFDSLESTINYLDKLGLPHDDAVCFKQDILYPADSTYIRSHIVDQKITGLGWSQLILPDSNEPQRVPIKQVFQIYHKTAGSFPPKLDTAITPKVNMKSLVSEISQSLLDFVSSHQAITIARDALYHARQRNILHSTRLVKQIASSAYNATESSFLQALTPTIKQIYWSSLQTRRMYDLQATRERLSALVYESILLMAVKNVALSTFSTLHYRFKLASSTISTWSTRAKSRSQLYQPVFFSHLLQMCKDMGIHRWNLVLLGSWPQVSKLFSKVSALPTTRIPSGSCIFDLFEAPNHRISLTWYDDDAHIDYGSPPPSAVIALSESALLAFPLPPSTITTLFDSDSQDFGEQYLFHLLQQTLATSESERRLVTLDIVTYFHSKYILPLPPTLLSLAWQLITDAILELLLPLNPPWSDHPNIPDPRPLLNAIKNWNFSQVTDIEASFDFCEQHSFTLVCLSHKLCSVETRLQTRITTTISPKLVDTNNSQSLKLLEAKGLENAIQHEQSRSDAFDSLLQNCLATPLSYQS